MISKLLIICCLAASVYAEAEEEPRIAGGFPARIQDYPHQVSLQTNFSNSIRHFCGGAIIAKNWILTAGHCITDISDIQKKQLRVVAGSTSLKAAAEDGEGQTIPASGDFYVHPDYMKDVGPNDIAVFKLESEFKYNDDVKNILLPAEGEDTQGKVKLSGWGSTRYFLNPYIPNTPDRLRRATFEVMETSKCREAYGADSKKMPDDANLCTKKVGIFSIPSSACSGDSGGPLIQDGKVVGVVSWGFLYCGLMPSVYARVSNYIDFIKEHVPEAFN